MSELLRAGLPLLPMTTSVGYRSTILNDSARERVLAVDIWYPSERADEPLAEYELLPGVAFAAHACTDAVPVARPVPVVVISHGRTGTRRQYAMLCEGLAARGYAVIASDHPGDTMIDWLAGTAVDDQTNELQRAGDIEFLVATLNDRAAPFLAGLSLDLDRFGVVGHSYGANTALRYAGTRQSNIRVRAVAGLQPFTRTVPADVLRSIHSPVLLIAGAQDQTTPPASDVDRAYEILVAASANVTRVDIDHAGHQACSDVGLYGELAPLVTGLPDGIRDYVVSLTSDVTGTVGDPWRPTVASNLEALAAWLDVVFDRDVETRRTELAMLSKRRGIVLRSTDLSLAFDG